MAATARASHQRIAGQALEAPEEGVICAFAFNDGLGVEVEIQGMDAAARRADWTWTHFRLADVRAQALIRRVGLPPSAQPLFLGQEVRVQIGEASGWVFGVLPDYERDLGGEPQDEGRISFAFDNRRLVTGRLHALLAVDDLRLAVGAGERLATPAAAVERLMELYAMRAEASVEDLGDRIAKVEDYVLTATLTPQESNLTALRRQVARRRRDLQLLRSALSRAVVGRRGRRIAALEDAAADLLAWLEDIDHEAAALQERGRLLHEEIDTRINAATNRSMRVLTIISTLLIPPTVIVGAFGMNLPDIPWANAPGGFWIASALCAAVVALAFWMLRRSGLLS
jgi:zinc transporter